MIYHQSNSIDSLFQDVVILYFTGLHSLTLKVANMPKIMELWYKQEQHLKKSLDKCTNQLESGVLSKLLLQPKLLRSKWNSAEVSHPMCNCLLAPYSRKLKYCSYRDPFEYSLAFKTAIKAKSARPVDFITSTLLSQDVYNCIYSIFSQINKKFKIQKYSLNLFKRQVIEKKNLQLNVPELWKSSGDWLGYIPSIW